MNGSTTGQVLKGLLAERVAKNPAYSLRALGRDLGVSHAMLSLVIQGKRSLSLHNTLRICQSLGPQNRWSEPLLLSVSHLSSGNSRAAAGPAPFRLNEAFFTLQQDRFRLLKEWYHLPLLDLTELEGSKPCPKWIAAQLGISREEARRAMSRLVRLGLLQIKGKHWAKTHATISIATRYGDDVLRSYHKQAIDRALKLLDDTAKEELEARDITAALIPVNPKRLEEAKQRIKKFRRKILLFLSHGGPRTELYQLNVQLFPLTKNRRKGAANAR